VNRYIAGVMASAMMLTSTPWAGGIGHPNPATNPTALQAASSGASTLSTDAITVPRLFCYQGTLLDSITHARNPSAATLWAEDDYRH
jgi:hypothetical protein